MPTPSALLPDSVARYNAVRSQTERLARPLGPEDQLVQSMPDVSPTKWHRAHITWFFETFLLSELPDYKRFDEAFAYLYNSYYESVGSRHPREQRGLVSRPTVAEIADYRAHVDEAMVGLILERPDLWPLVELGLHHEQQHQELMLMDIKHVFSSTILKPAYQQRAHEAGPDAAPLSWTAFAGGTTTIGAAGPVAASRSAADRAAYEFAFDNEEPRHEALVQAFRLANRAATVGDWLEFIADGGYQTVGLWLSEGWATVQQHQWAAPLYWEDHGGEAMLHTLQGLRPLDPSEPVTHISYFEADAFATWAGARLPTEFEWEHAATAADPQPAISGLAINDAETELFHPRSTATAGLAPESGIAGLFGDTWEWTSSSYSPYPGFQVAPGAVGEYNGKFMVNQMVLRGGSCVTPAGHVRPSYRNFFPAASRWQFGGVRLAAEA